MSASYAPPSHPPPNSAASSSISPPPPGHTSYAPTQTPTPGQPLLRNGKMLVYPHAWQGCPKCQDTGYKQGDPTHPCRKCWQDYGRPFNPLLISSAGLQGAKVLQRPLPAWGSGGGAMLPGRMQSQAPSGYAGYPGAAGPMSPQSTGSINPFLADQHTGATSAYGSPFAPQSTGGSYAPPLAPPPPPTLPPRRAEPPRVNRTDESREDDINEDGEAPPAYEDAVAAGPDGAVPPQRPGEPRRTTSTSHSTAAPAASPPAPPAAHQHHAPPPNIHHAPPHQQYYPQHQHHQPVGPHGPWAGGMGYGGGPTPHFVPYGHVPPPQALVVRPGDPRIGGRLCHKCGGDGVREDFWFGSSETCRTCNGTGRIL